MKFEKVVKVEILGGRDFENVEKLKGLVEVANAENAEKVEIFEIFEIVINLRK